LEAFGVSLVTPCPTRWNSLYESLFCFLKNHKSLENANELLLSLGLPALTKDIELLSEYMSVMEPVARILDILQGEKKIVLPLLTKLKQQLAVREFPNLGLIRDRILASVDKR
jgi:hypothetical protein